MDPGTRDGVRLGLRLAFAHHPLCDRFHEDVLHRRVPLCAGCALTWPLFYAVLMATLLLRPAAGPWPLVAMGLVLGLPQCSTYRVRWSRPVRAAIKALGGAGLGLAVAGGLLLPWPWSWKVVAAALVLTAFGGMQLLRLRSVLATCKACPWAVDWGVCPGFRPEGGWTDPPAGHQGPGRLFPGRRGRPVVGETK